jgi:large subunit ribosomal protein L6
MSRIGRLPITVPAGVEVKVDGSVVSVKGTKGELNHTVASPIEVSLDADTLTVARPNDERASRSLHGLTPHPDLQHDRGRYQGLREEA